MSRKQELQLKKEIGLIKSDELKELNYITETELKDGRIVLVHGK